MSEQDYRDARLAQYYAVNYAYNGANPDVRKQAIKDLVPLASKHVVALTALWVAATNDADPFLRRLAIEGLVSLATNGDALSALWLCSVAIKDPHPDVRKVAIDALVPLAEKHEDVRVALDHVAQTANIERLNYNAAAALRSLKKQAAINPSSQQEQQLVEGRGER